MLNKILFLPLLILFFSGNSFAAKPGSLDDLKNLSVSQLDTLYASSKPGGIPGSNHPGADAVMKGAVLTVPGHSLGISSDFTQYLGGGSVYKKLQ